MPVEPGMQFGKLTVESFSHKVKNNKYWWCTCSCEDKTRKIVAGSSLLSGHSKSCGCIKRNQEFEKNTVRKYPEPTEGAVYGRLTIVSFDHKDATNKWWLCSCSCGNSKVIREVSLVRGDTQSCGCIRKETTAAKNKENRKYDPVKPGDMFNRLTVMFLDREDGYKKFWRCLCTCGEEAVVLESSLTSQTTQSCGCLQRERTSKAKKTHGLSHTQEYRTPRINAYYKAHPEKKRVKDAKRRASKVNATVAWDQEKTKEFYTKLATQAKELEEMTGVKYHVDHIVPLVGKVNNEHVVCGLHVWNNFQLLRAEDNLKKHCTSWPNMPDSML